MAGAADPPFSVLFVCTSNAIRSPMAAALMRLRYGPLARVDSAGVSAPLAAGSSERAGCIKAENGGGVERCRATNAESSAAVPEAVGT